MKKIRKGLSKKQKKSIERKVQETLNKVGANFPREESESSSSGEDSGAVGGTRSHRKKKVKSGAKIQIRPVIRTELWPHTVANEEDGEQATSENITLAKFMASYTFITATCGRAESSGRSVLLHAVCLVLESMQWPDARTFHNLMMIKIEQGRLDWDDDFAALAEDFIDKKVRLAFRSKYARSSNSSAGGRGFSSGKSFKSSNQKNGFNRNRPLYGAICFQWNSGTCSYGEECKRWHVCKTCADSGKLGEKHKASSHDSSGGIPKKKV